ncbi:Serine phosphatase RsbU, regulator of sigma subunit [Streptomyces sp. 1222.5]|uniref:PP2C family protein-serine/threonine phosphatase n=1 Tax=unclassified Streptomyces TaxID=2593676 RepID=UPI0008973017|nr:MULTISPECIES: PP2C family protein-serine/threonine phosphatase [unclassified Streptomyces]PKW05225.1 serine phosphatase RsbU (regulator of sigma subunit) [Streptomyces sp. 5112.2]SEC06988.1 Serine phosphatase RsbU, regulator of sigma subunit [Streptomyces sp. 2231.1]SED46640.1 Serine phosphatase RsbU, regulator of sigma subunit [Streptomyces sp. 1222.5]
MIESGGPRLRRRHGLGRFVRLSPVLLTVVIAGLAYATPPDVAFSRLLPAAPALAAAMWPVLPTVLLGTVCLLLMIGLSFVFPGLNAWWTSAGIIAVTVAAAYGSHVRLQRERTLIQVRLVADAAQQVVLSPMPRRCGSIEIESLYLAAAAEARIGGDFYEVVDTRFGVRLLIGDVRGKGLPAVGAAAAIVNAFREAAHDEAELVSVARRLDASSIRYNAVFPPEGTLERFATALLVEIPHGGGHLEILNCGHPPPLLLNRRELRVLEPTAPSPLLNLAELIGDHYNVDSFDFTPGDLLFLYTDGIVETRAGDGAFFPLAAWMRQQPPMPPHELLTVLHRDLIRYSRGRLDDDIAALAVRLCEP